MLLEIGKYAKLRIVKSLSFGSYLDGGPFGEILLPVKEVPETAKPEDVIDVFIYCDSEDRIIATTLKPKAQVGELAYLEVKDVSEYGAFLDWGIPTKHLFVPFREQLERMEIGRSYVVFLYLDEKTDRIAASMKLNKIIEIEAEGFEDGQKVDILVTQRTEMGFKVIVEDKYWGVLYHNEIFQTVRIGDRLGAYIKKVREDKKLDIVLQKQGYLATIPISAQLILDMLKENEGFLPLTDKSPPTLIYDMLQMSKKSFKKAIGGLYKQKIIQIKKDGIHLK